MAVSRQTESVPDRFFRPSRPQELLSFFSSRTLEFPVVSFRSEISFAESGITRRSPPSGPKTESHLSQACLSPLSFFSTPSSPSGIRSRSLGGGHYFVLVFVPLLFRLSCIQRSSSSSRERRFVALFHHFPRVPFSVLSSLFPPDAHQLSLAASHFLACFEAELRSRSSPTRVSFSVFFLFRFSFFLGFLSFSVFFLSRSLTCFLLFVSLGILGFFFFPVCLALVSSRQTLPPPLSSAAACLWMRLPKDPFFP